MTPVIGPVSLDPAKAIDLARDLVVRDYPEAIAVFLGQELVDGVALPPSSIVLLVLVRQAGSGETKRSASGLPGRGAPRIHTLTASGWPVRVSLHTPSSLAEEQQHELNRRRPTLVSLCAEGVILVDRAGTATALREEARRLLEAGPEPLDEAEVEGIRYQLTDATIDLCGSTSPDDDLCIAADIAALSCAIFFDRYHRFPPVGRRSIRALTSVAPERARELVGALRTLTCRGDRQPLVRFATGALREVGGPLYNGFRRIGEEPPAVETVAGVPTPKTAAS